MVEVTGDGQADVRRVTSVRCCHTCSPELASDAHQSRKIPGHPAASNHAHGGKAVSRLSAFVDVASVADGNHESEQHAA